MSEHDVRIGLIGAGRMGADHARRIHERISGARLAVVGDPDADRAHAAAADTGARVTTDPSDVITSADVDAVVIASPGHTHEPLLLAALEHRIPVLCEKPLTPDAESAQRIVAAEADTGRRLIQLGFMRRFDAEYAHLKQVLRDRELGEALLLHCTHRNAATPPEFTDEMMIYDSVVHEVDTVRWLLDSEISAMSVRAPGRSTRAAPGLTDPQLVTIETDEGALATVEIFVNCRFGYQVRCEAVCEDGTARIGAESGLVRHTRDGWGGSVPAGFPERFGQAFDLEVQRWVEAAQHGEVVEGAASTWDGYAAAAACAAGVRAQASGERVPVSLGEMPKLYAT
ncbi:Gfo/Idh/MocA family oxidoreductase [Salinifilum aidingensis]